MTDPLSSTLAAGPVAAGAGAGDPAVAIAAGFGTGGLAGDFGAVLSAQIGANPPVAPAAPVKMAPMRDVAMTMLAQPTMAKAQPVAVMTPPATAMDQPAAEPAPPALPEVAPVAIAGSLPETGKILPADLPLAPRVAPLSPDQKQVSASPDIQPAKETSAAAHPAADAVALLAAVPLAATTGVVLPAADKRKRTADGDTTEDSAPADMPPADPTEVPVLALLPLPLPAAAPSDAEPAGTTPAARGKDRPIAGAPATSNSPAPAAAKPAQFLPANPFAAALTITVPLGRPARPGQGVAAGTAPALTTAPAGDDTAAIPTADFVPAQARPDTALLSPAQSLSVGATPPLSVAGIRGRSIPPTGQGDLGQGQPPMDSPASMSPAGPPLVVSPEATSGPATFPTAAVPTPAPAPTYGSGPGQDMSALVDRLVEARAAARSSSAPIGVATAVRHAEFGRVSLNFEQQDGKLSVSMASADPGFAPAAQAALAGQSLITAAADTASTDTASQRNPQRHTADAAPGFTAQADAGAGQQGQPRPQAQASSPTAFAPARSRAQAESPNGSNQDTPGNPARNAAQPGVFA